MSCVSERQKRHHLRVTCSRRLQNFFPGKYIHIGGDETPTDKWEASPHVQAYAGMVGLANLGPDIHEAWNCLVSQILKELNRTPVIWDDNFAARSYSVSTKCPNAEQDWVVQAWKLEPPVGTFSQESVNPLFPFRTVASPMKSCYLDYPVASIDFNKTLELDLGGRPGMMLGGSANMWTEDSQPEDVPAKVYPRFLGLAERFWGAVPPKQKRPLDLSPYEAAHMHCTETAPLATDLGFACGRFELTIGGRSDLFKGAHVTSTIDAFAPNFSPERALDGDFDTYFWGISPKFGDYFDVSWQPAKGSSEPFLGHWLRSVTIATGAKERPGDNLVAGELHAVQWLPTGKGNFTDYKQSWQHLANFKDGKASADEALLAKGPALGLRIKVIRSQTKWMAIPEIAVVKGEAQPHPVVSDLPRFSASSERRQSHRKIFR